jgi:hypothetical protein
LASRLRSTLKQIGGWSINIYSQVFNFTL